MRFIATTSDKVNTIEVVSGQMIFSKDNRVIYLDSTERTAFRTIITLMNENQRVNLVSPVEGFYFVIETKDFWYYDNTEWSLIAGEKENIYYPTREDFPAVGLVGLLYIDSGSHKIYEWDKNQNDYMEMNTSQWEGIS